MTIQQRVTNTEMPTVIFINSMPYDVVEKEDLRAENSDYRRLYGQIDYSKMQIELEKDMQPPMRTAVLVHEVIHGILAQAGVEDHDEQLIDILTFGFIGVMRQNPELAKLVAQ